MMRLFDAPFFALWSFMFGWAAFMLYATVHTSLTSR